MRWRVRVSGSPWSPLEVWSQCHLPSLTSISRGVFTDYVMEQLCALWGLSVEDKAFRSCLGTKVSLESVVVALVWSTPCTALTSTGVQLEIFFQMPVAAVCEKVSGALRSWKGGSGERWEGGTRLRSEVSLALHVSELRRECSEISAGLRGRRGRGVAWEVFLFRSVEAVAIKHLGRVGAAGEELGKETFPAAPWWWLLCRGGTGTDWGACCQKIKCL